MLFRRQPAQSALAGSDFLLAACALIVLSATTLQGTLLGDFVLLQTAVPQGAGCAFAVVLSFLSAADLLLLQV